MAARLRSILAPPAVTPQALPTPPASYPAVAAARELLDKAAAERARAEAALGEAQAALEQHRDAAAEQLLADLAGDGRSEDDEAALVARIEAARRRLQTATAAVGLARQRHEQELATARESFSRELRPALEAAMEAARAKVRVAIEVNEQLRALAVYGREHDPRAPAPWELAFPLPNLARLDELDADRAELFADPAPLPLGRVLVRMLVVEMPYNAGETVGLPEAEAVTFVRAGVAECVRPEDARRLKLDRLQRFTAPTAIKIVKTFTPAAGQIINPGEVCVFEPALAARIVNLGYGEVA